MWKLGKGEIKQEIGEKGRKEKQQRMETKRLRIGLKEGKKDLEIER